MPPRLLPEWAPQRLVQLCWPSQAEYWGSAMPAAQQCHSEIIRQLSQYQTVLLLHAPQLSAQALRERLDQAGCRSENLQLEAIDNNDIWCRDYGPLSMQGANGSELLNFQFTGWGGKFAAEKDNASSQALVQKGVYARLNSFELILEGGAIDTDGEGTLLTTSTCLLNQNRNANFSRADYEAFMATQLGIKKIHWLEQGYLAGDDTDSHVDMLARFAPNNRIVYQACERESDEHFLALQALGEELASLRNQQQQPYELVPLPLPEARFDAEGQRLPASYANFLISNQQVLIPAYNCSQDQQALAAIVACFPERKAVLINCEALIQQYGSLHCATMQVAA